MCHSRFLHTHINKIHERTLRITYKDNNSSFEQLLIITGSVTIHHKNLQVLLATEVYKTLNNLASPLMSELFKEKDIKYNLRKGNTLVSKNVKTTTYGLDSVSYLAPKLWMQVPIDMKNSASLAIFKQRIRTWVPDSCLCRLCKVYVQNLGYI